MNLSFQLDYCPKNLGLFSLSTLIPEDRVDGCR